MQKKITQIICLCSIFAGALSAISVYAVITGFADAGISSFVATAITILGILALIFVLIYYIAKLLSEKIVSPVKNMDLTAETHENIYPEFSSIIHRIERQNREISRQIDRVKRQKNRLQVVGEAMGEGLILFDSEGNIISLNPSSEKIFDTDSSSAVGKPFFRISKSFEIYEAIERACKGEGGVITETIGNKLYQIYLSPATEDKKVSSVIMLLLDVSELEKSEKIRREFTSNVSHELKTPLTTILGYSQIINNGIAKPEDIHDFTGRIEKETTRLITLVDDIMKLSRLDDDELVGEFTQIHILQVANEVLERLSHKAEKNNLTLSISGSDTVINGDLSQITELLYNLTDNAIKYNKKDGKVLISIIPNGFSVSDTGLGIPEKYRDRIYERFFRVDKSHSKTIGGTGLGLSIVKHIVQHHNGTISLQSQENIGTTFTVTFPK